MDEKEIYKVARVCAGCGQESKLVLPVEHMCKNLKKPLIQVLDKYENLCFTCLNKFTNQNSVVDDD